MSTEGFKRKLTAILGTDVEGYSRLMGEDEDATIRTLTTYRELMSTLIQKHRGRVMDSPGDNLLAEFGSVVDAVRCAVEVQEELRVRNAECPGWSGETRRKAEATNLKPISSGETGLLDSNQIRISFIPTESKYGTANNLI